jgi:hypothetical protein
MVVRLSDIRNGTSEEKKEKKSGVVRLSDLRETKSSEPSMLPVKSTSFNQPDKEISPYEMVAKESVGMDSRIKKINTDAVKVKEVESEKNKKEQKSFDESLSPYEKWYENNVGDTFIGKTLDKLQGADRSVSNFKAGALDTGTLGLTQGIGRESLKAILGGEENLKPILQDRLDSTSYKAGQIAGYVAPGVIADRAVVKLGGEALKRLPKVSQGLVRGSASGALDSAAQEVGDVAFREGQFDPLNVALGAGLGGAIGAAIPAIGSGLRAARETVARPFLNAAENLPPNQPIIARRASQGGNVSPAIKAKNVTLSADNPISANQPVRLSDIRGEEPSVSRERGLVGNIESSGKLSDEAMDTIRQGDTSYDPITNAETVRQANVRLEEGGMGSNKGYLMNKDPGKDYFSPEDIALGFRLIDEYSAIKDYDSVAELVQQLSKAGTLGGQSIQINAIYNRLTPQGILKVATRVLNEGVKDVQAQKALSPELTEQLSTAATAMRDATGKQNLAKEAITIIEKSRTGATLTEEEVAKIKSFANEANKLIAREPTIPGDPKTRVVDKVKKASASAADAARKRLKASRNQLNATPLGYYKDLAIIGFDHMMNGAVKFADFAGKMRTEFGEGINDYLDKTYLNAFNRYRRVNKIPQSEFEKITNRAISGQGFTEADADLLRKMAIELSQLEGVARNDAMSELQVAFNTLREGSRGKKAASVLRSVQLGNARTIIRNEISNNAFYALEQMKRKFLDTPIDLVASKLTGKDREIFWKGNPSSWRQYFKDWKTGYVEGRKGLNPGGLQSQYDLGNLAFNPTSTKITDKLGSFLERNVGAFLKAGDYAASNRAISTELNQVAHAKAYAEGYRGKDLARKAEEYFHTADETMSAQADEYGRYMTFQDKNFLSDAAVNLRDKVLNAGKDFGLGNIVLNYPKTPANILMRAIDYSPLGYVKFMTQVGKAIAGKDITKKQLINTFTRALAGTGIAGMGMYLSQLGILNVLPSKNVGMSELERKAGKIPNSLNIDALKRYVLSFGDPEEAKPRDGDTYASVDWFQPLAIPLSVGAAYGQADKPGRLKTSINAADVATQSVDAALESFGNMSAYKNIKDLVGSSYSTPSEKLGKLSANAASAFVPSILGQTRNVLDPYQRESKEPGFLGQAKGQLMNRIPGLSNQLPRRVDTFGDDKKNDFSVGKRILNSFLNPSIVDTYEPSSEAKAVLDLIERTGETRLAPDRPQKSFTFKKNQIKFTPEEYLKYQKSTGAQLTAGLNRNIEYLNNPNISDEKKIKRVDQIIGDAGEKAKKEYRKLKGIR